MADGTPGGVYFQYGCGLSAPEGWINYDSSPTLRLQRLPAIGGLFARQVRFPVDVAYGDVVKGLPLADESADGAYCSHVLEHLSLADCRTALRETRRVLKPGGVFRLVLPDLAFLARTYLEGEGPEAAPTFMRKSHLGVETRPRGAGAAARAWLGNSKHLWMWDYPALAAELEKAGFRDIRRARFGDSGVAAYDAVELESRWTNCLGIQAHK